MPFQIVDDLLHRVAMVAPSKYSDAVVHELDSVGAFHENTTGVFCLRDRVAISAAHSHCDSAEFIRHDQLRDMYWVNVLDADVVCPESWSSTLHHAVPKFLIFRCLSCSRNDLPQW